MNGLDLFSGIGGLTLALSPWSRPVAYCESDKYAQAVLLDKMYRGWLPDAPIWDDVRTLMGSHIPEPIDFIYGGFPCQDISSAGRGAGLAGQRSGLYWELHRLVKEIKPMLVFLENVPAIRTRGLIDVVRSFADIGYDCRWTCVSAEEVGAPHLRKRWFLLAYTHGEFVWGESRRGTREGREGSPITVDDGHDGSVAQATDSQAMLREEIQRSESDGDHGCAEKMADADSQRFEHYSEMPQRIQGESRWDPTASSSWWDAEPNVGRVADGIPHRVDRLRGLGNAVVPLQARTAFKRLLGLE